MGEVYRADDLRLEQPVALKFLREEIGTDLATRERFVSEVKLARSVTHANVCRVHDLGEVDGLLYLSMEYVDGEDLAALLRRIGAPSEQKALEIAGQLCAGLAAAHAKGVLHRDLKPANVMIDGAGKVRITDFGLAIVAGDEGERGLVAGTPAYMAPEQLAGAEATAKSDIYALGLVLYELFTGARVWQANDVGHLRDLHATCTPNPPSTHARSLDARVERAILSCLERDPERRPRSPTSVAAALTGADPIAAALAAGETPTPEMVAASGGEGTISMTAAGAALAAILVLFAALVFVAPRASLYGHVPLANEPAVLAARAREILESSGLAVPDGDRAFGYSPLRDQAVGGKQPVAQFWYRESPYSLQPSGVTGRTSSDDPPIQWPGMVSLGLSARGKLDWLEAAPPSSSDPSRSGARCDWDPLFAAAGLNRADFKPVPPRRTPPQGCDERVAWTGPDPEEPGVELTVEGAAFEGRPVSFGGRHAPLRSRPRKLGTSSSVAHIQFWLFTLALFGGIPLAWRNLTSGRGDRRTAARLAVVVFLLQTCVWLLRANHTTDVLLEGWLLERGLSAALYAGGFVWVLYLALEPYVRRIWPDRLVSWSRLLAGRWRDPLVARDLMAGIGAGITATLANSAAVWIGMRLYAAQVIPVTRNFPDTAGLRGSIAQLCQQGVDGAGVGFMLTFSLVALRFFVRRNWIAYLLFTPAMFGNPLAFSIGVPVLDWAYLLFMVPWTLLMVSRCGLFAMAVAVATFGFLNFIPLTSELSAWYAGQTIFAALVVCGLAIVSARFATGKRVRVTA
ncbi:MAG: serine/threonine protein kinase [Planctomycetes bacterium]|nr:serine/threonine protein kinase [Planctomycetota bacterium]